MPLSGTRVRASASSDIGDLGQWCMCPTCQADVAIEGDVVSCVGCGATYRIADGIVDWNPCAEKPGGWRRDAFAQLNTPREPITAR